MMKERLKTTAVPIQLPIGSEADFNGIIDLVKMKAEIYVDDLGNTIQESDIPGRIPGAGAAVSQRDGRSRRGSQRRIDG